MTYSQAKIDAYAQLEIAINNLRDIYTSEDKNDDEPNILTGWVLLTSGIEFCQPEPDDLYCDDVDTKSVMGFYSCRGQDPTLSHGIIQEAVRHYNRIQHSCGGY